MALNTPEQVTTPGSKLWNDAMYKKHPTPYSGLAGMVERFRVRSIIKMASITTSDHVLEVGCEAGNLLVSLPEAARFVGADISEAALEDAQQNLDQKGRTAELIACDATEDLPFDKGEFSVVICSEMLEHVPHPEKVIANLIKISGEKTRIILSVPNEEPKLQIKRWLTKIGFMQLFMPTIEEEQSEWHLHAFSMSSFHKLLAGKLEIHQVKLICGLHIVAQCSARR